MKRRSSPRLDAYAVVAACGLVAALALRRPELAVAAAPFAVVLAAGVATAVRPEVDVGFRLASERVVEGEDLESEITVRSERAVDRLELLLATPSRVQPETEAAFALRLRPGDERSLTVVLTCTRWGIYDVGRIELRARDALGVVVWEASVDARRRLDVYPRSEEVRRILAPRETQVFTGSEVSHAKADGIEYADLRVYVPGDRLRAINWRASARRDGLVVNLQHPERNTDVVLFVDSFADVRRGRRSTLEDGVRATAALAARYLERRDRVGLVGFGGLLRWLQPAMGESQRFRLVETLLETGVAPTYAWRDVNVIPARILPPKALIVAITPLLDDRFVTAIADLRARRFDVAAIEVDPVPLVPPGTTELDDVVYRMWLLERETVRARLAGLGVAVARWGENVQLEAALEGVRSWRRRARLARV